MNTNIVSKKDDLKINKNFVLNLCKRINNYSNAGKTEDNLEKLIGHRYGSDMYMLNKYLSSAAEKGPEVFKQLPIESIDKRYFQNKDLWTEILKNNIFEDKDIKKRLVCKIEPDIAKFIEGFKISKAIEKSEDTKVFKKKNNHVENVGSINKNNYVDDLFIKDEEGVTNISKMAKNGTFDENFIKSLSMSNNFLLRALSVTDPRDGNTVFLDMIKNGAVLKDFQKNQVLMFKANNDGVYPITELLKNEKFVGKLGALENRTINEKSLGPVTLSEFCVLNGKFKSLSAETLRKYQFPTNNTI